MPWSKLSVELHDANPYKAKILLNGIEVPGLRELTIDWAHDNATIATLTIGVEELHIDTVTMIQLRAIMEAHDPVAGGTMQQHVYPPGNSCGAHWDAESYAALAAWPPPASAPSVVAPLPGDDE